MHGTEPTNVLRELASCEGACYRPNGHKEIISNILTSIKNLPAHFLEGRVTTINGSVVGVKGISNHLVVNQRVILHQRAGPPVSAEIAGFREGFAQAIAQRAVAGLGPGAMVLADPGAPSAELPVSDEWLGRVVDPLGNPLDGRGLLCPGPRRPLRGAPPGAVQRGRLGPPVEMGIAVLDAFATCRQGQRLGLFAGSGVGKSTLLSMLARYVACDVIVLALVGERGREVREFLEDDLGPDGLARSVVVVATSDESPLLRRDAAHASMTIAEHFRDQGRSVLLLMDSVTRFCLALREIGLSIGEPPGTRGYPASVFAELPRLLERAGPGREGSGHITALFAVLVEGDDHDEPIADAVRGFLDGHVVLDRRIGESGRFPAVDVVRSVSRTAPGCLSSENAALVRRARGILARYNELADLIRLGAYKPGSDPLDDEAATIAPKLNAMLHQQKADRTGFTATFARLAKTLAESNP